MGYHIRGLFTAGSFLLARGAITPPPLKKPLMMSDNIPDPHNFTNTDLLQIILPIYPTEMRLVCVCCRLDSVRL